MNKYLIFILLFLLFLIFFCRNDKAVFDIPKLSGKTINEVNSLIGKPYFIERFSNKNWVNDDGISFYSASYRKGGVGLIINFDSKTDRAISFFLHTTRSYPQLEDLMKLANIDSTNKENFSIESDTSYVGLSLFLYDDITIYPLTR